MKTRLCNNLKEHLDMTMRIFCQPYWHIDTFPFAQAHGRLRNMKDKYPILAWQQFQLPWECFQGFPYPSISKIKAIPTTTDTLVQCSVVETIPRICGECRTSLVWVAVLHVNFLSFLLLRYFFFVLSSHILARCVDGYWIWVLFPWCRPLLFALVWGCGPSADIVIIYQVIVSSFSRLCLWV